MEIVLVNPPTLYRAKSVDEIQELELFSGTIPYYERLLTLDTGKINGFSTLPGEHLGLQSISGYLHLHGHRVNIVNACVELHSSLSQTLKKILQYSFDLIGFSGPLDVFGENAWLALRLREKGFTGHITLGHDFATLNHKIILKKYRQFDSIVRGEGEETLLEIVSSLDTKNALKNIAGLSYRDANGRIHTNPPRPAIDLDTLSWPTRDTTNSVIDLHMSPSLYTKRGCLYKCSFCTTGTVPSIENYQGRNIWRVRSVQNTVDEIEFLLSKFKVPFLTIVDDLFIAKGSYGTQHGVEFAHELLNRKIKIPFMIDCRVDSISYKNFSLLKRAGLKKVFVGVESASFNTLKVFNKGYSPQIITEKLHILDNLNIEFILGYIMFNPFETLHGLEQNYKLIAELGRKDFGLFLQSVRIYPGTQLHHQLSQQNLLQGEFPYFSAKYLDPQVNRVRNMLSEFGNLAVPMLRSKKYKENKLLAKKTQEHLYDVIRVSLGNIISGMKENAEDKVDIYYNQMIDEFTQCLD